MTKPKIGLMHVPTFNSTNALHLAKQTLDIESQAVLGLKTYLDNTFVRAMELILACQGRVVVMGMGKSGHIGRKIAATLASTGTPAMFVHPAEASHGDLGMVTRQDVVLAISNSGEVNELEVLLPLFKRLGVPLIAMTGNPQSSLGLHADACLRNTVEREACPLNLAPTSSTTAQLALGDALAVALLDARGFQAEDFARSHPGGNLGRKLLTHVRDVMRQGDDLPIATPLTGFFELMRIMSAKGLGAAVVLDNEQRVVGIFTDGDLRRCIEQSAAQGSDLRGVVAKDVMHKQPHTLPDTALAALAAESMERLRITCVLITDSSDHLVGMLSVNDLLRARVI